MRMFKGMALVLAGLMLVSCGGGKGGGGDSTDPEAPSASDLSLTLDTNSVDNSGTKTVALTVTAVDDNRVGLADVPVSMRVDNGAVVVMDSAVTSASGEVTGLVRIGSDRSNRLVTVTASSGGVSREATFQVIGANLQATLQPAVVEPRDSASISYRLLDTNALPMANQTISVTGPGVTARTGTTDSNGEYLFRYTAPATIGNLTITAQAGGDQDEQTVRVQSGTSSIPNVTEGAVSSASVSANPSVVPVNTDGTNNLTSIRALFIGTNNRPIQNVRVRFDLAGDVNNIGGTVSSGNQIVYSDVNGQAVTSYIPGSRSSPTDGVTVRACWGYTDAQANACRFEATTTLTVISEALGVTIGTNELILLPDDDLTYAKEFVVLVVDSSGQAKSGVQVSPSVDIQLYEKGRFGLGDDGWTRALVKDDNSPTGAINGPECLNEDANRNGVIEASENNGVNTTVNGVSIPDNGNGQLDPRRSDVAVSVVGSNKTDSRGMVVVQIEYPRNVATWDYVKILVSASGVGGTEGRASYSLWLPAPASAFTTTDTTPAFHTSPYGIANSCNNPN